jgi:5-methylcytosine-specific restriction endonuclease McrA
MKLRNNFTIKTRWLFFDVRYMCFDCGGNGSGCGGTELHHIIGRGSNSPYNACVLCKKCHAKVGHTDEEQQGYIHTTISHLDLIEYEPTEKDTAFLKKYYEF